MDRTRPDRHGTELVVPALPREGLGISQRFYDQVHAFQHPPTALRWVHTVGLVLIGRAPEEAYNQASIGQSVQHPQFFGDTDRVIKGQKLTQDGNLRFLAPLSHRRSHDRRVSRGYSA